MGNAWVTRILIGALITILLVGGLVGFRLLMPVGQSKTAVSSSLTPVPATTEVVLDERIGNLETSLADVVGVIKSTTGKQLTAPASVSTLENRVKTLETTMVDLQNRIKLLESGSKSTVVTTSTTTSKPPDYIRIGWNASTTATDWTSVGVANISVAGSDYGGSTSMKFEVSIKTQNSSGRAYARLFNVDDNSAITGSEVSTDVASNTWVSSGTFTLPSTRKNYYLQMKSTSGVGAQVSDAQIKVSY